MNEFEFNLLDFFIVLKRRIRLVLAFIIIFTLAFGVYTIYFTEAQYQSTARIMSKPVYVNDLINYDQLNVSSSMTSVYAEMIKGDTICTKADEQLKLATGTVKKALTVTKLANSQILSITAKTESPTLSKHIVDTVLDIFYKESEEKLGSSGIVTLDEATIASAPSTLPLSENIIKGAVIGLLISCVIVFLQFILDNRLHTKADAEKFFDLPVLGVIPDIGGMNETH